MLNKVNEKKNLIQERTFEFAIEIIKIAKELKLEKSSSCQVSY